MARTADHIARRRQIVDGAKRVALAGGLGALTVANTARDAGVSVGLVQHYYDSKERLLADTLGSVLDGILSRVDEATASAEHKHARIEQMMVAGITQFLPLDPTRRHEAYLRHTFAALALDNEQLHEHQRQFQQAMVDRATLAVRNGVECGEVDPDIEAGTAGYTLVALADGLATSLLITDTSEHRRWAEAALQGHISSLFSGICAREGVGERATSRPVQGQTTIGCCSPDGGLAEAGELVRADLDDDSF